MASVPQQFSTLPQPSASRPQVAPRSSQVLGSQTTSVTLGSPQWLGTPLPPQVSGASQPPHLMMPPQPSATGPHSPLSQVFLQLSPTFVSMLPPPPLPLLAWLPPPPFALLLLPAVPLPSWSPGFTTSGAPEQATTSQEIRANAVLLKLRLEPTVALWFGLEQTPGEH